jgi:hypothetical protein
MRIAPGPYIYAFAMSCTHHADGWVHHYSVLMYSIDCFCKASDLEHERLLISRPGYLSMPQAQITAQRALQSQ